MSVIDNLNDDGSMTAIVLPQLLPESSSEASAEFRGHMRRVFARLCNDDSTYGNALELAVYRWQKERHTQPGSRPDYFVKAAELVANLQRSATLIMRLYTPEMLPYLTIDELGIESDAAKLRRAVRDSNVAKQAVLEEDEKKVAALGASTSLLKCSSCGHTDVSVELKQTRSADEGMTAFCCCLNPRCRRRWRM